MTPAFARVAAYYAPEPEDPLWRAGCAWLGRDAITGTATAQPAIAGLAPATSRPAGYGFHATLKAPFRLRAGLDLAHAAAAARDACRDLAPFQLPKLHVAALGTTLALIAAQPAPPLRALADRLVELLDPLRAPVTAAELARRRAAPLRPEQEAMLQRWGYPDVFALWRFHMTLTDRLTGQQAAALGAAAERYFAAACALPRVVGSVCLFVQPTQAAPFQFAARIPLGG